MRILLCAPDFFDVRYEINPWMDVENNPQTLKAFSQWRNIIDAIGKAGGIIEHIRPHPDFPDMVFTANAGLIKGKKVVLSNFKYEERQGEQPLFEEWFLKKGYQSILLPDEIHFEGAGDGLFFRDLLFLGHGFRTDKESHKMVAECLGVEYVSLELIDPRFYHLDTCMFISDEQVCFYADAFTPESLSAALSKLTDYVCKENLSIKISAVSESQATNFICNSLEVKGTVITPANNHGSVFSRAHVCDMSEFMKSGGAVKCLTLTL